MSSKPVTTAFTVVQHPDGNWEAIADTDLELVVHHKADVHEMRYGCSRVVGDIDASHISGLVMHHMAASRRQDETRETLAGLGL